MEDFEKFFSLIIEHNARYRTFNAEDLGWTVAKSKISGKGVIATKCFQPGDIIFIDHPLVVGPRFSPDSPLTCVVCYSTKNLRPCSRNCSLPTCSPLCENDERHTIECLYFCRLRNGNSSNNLQSLGSVTPVRCLNIDRLSKEIIENHLHKINGPRQGLEVVLLRELTRASIPKEEEDFMRVCCRVLDANAFEIPLTHGENTKGVSLRGLFPMASTMNHSCIPNTTHTFNKDHQMIIRASKNISEGEEITTTYVTLLLGTTARRSFLAKSKHFHCRCCRCENVTEFGTYLSALTCRNSSCPNGILLPSNPLQFLSDWKCVTCESVLSADKIGLIQKIVAQELAKLDTKSPEKIMSYIRNYRIVADTNHTKIQFKYSLIGIIGYAAGYEWADVEDEVLLYKMKICEEISTIAKKLKLGECEIKNFCISELSKTEEELRRRGTHLTRCAPE